MAGFQRGFKPGEIDTGESKLVAFNLMGYYLLDLADGLNPAVDENRNSVADGFDVRNYVAAEEYSCSLLLLFENYVAHVASADRIQPAERLVQNKQFRIVQQRLGKTDALQHSS